VGVSAGVGAGLVAAVASVGSGFAQDKSGITATLFLEFPKSDAITPGDGEVELSTVIDRYQIKKSFKLKDMLYKGALAF
jgi:hypothetical protein